jgi:hypothetical protein
MNSDVFYHFLSSNHAIHDLERGILRVSLIDDLNDPFEIMPYFSKENRKHYNNFLKIRQSFAEEYGIICFSMGYSNPLLWGHYGDKHKGIALGLNILHHELIEVEYHKKRLEIPFSNINVNDSKSIMSDLIQIKYKTWEYEQERRIIVKLKDCALIDENYFISLKDNFEVAQIILGSKFTYNEKDLMNLSKRYGAKIIPTKLAKRSFEIDEDKVKINEFI